MIELHCLTKSYGGHLILDNINLFIQEGEIFGIIGKSGAGKSTLLRTINLLERPDSGEVIVNNQVISELPPALLSRARHQIGMIFQQFNLLQYKTVYDNIALPMRIQGIPEVDIKMKVEELLPLVELEAKAQHYPSQLSGGQKQRVAIARALSISPKILLSDEATSSLDPETTNSILDLLKKINQLYGITLVLITHEMDVVKQVCHRLAVMETGQITEVTSLANAFTNEYSQARYLLYKQLSPSLPDCLQKCISSSANNKPLLRLFFQDAAATTPFISQTSRELHLDINILLASIDRFEGVTYGVIVVELNANPTLLKQFIQHCQQAQLTVEILGYVTDNTL